MNTTKIISEFFEKRLKESHYNNIQPLPNNDKFNWIIHKSKLATLKLNIEMPYKDMYNEAYNLLHDFYEHRAYGEPNVGWKSLVIHGRGKHITLGDDQYDLTKLPDYHWTEVCDKCPITTNFLKNDIPLNDFLRIRFMLLKPGGYIIPHSDDDCDRLQTFNLALNQPDDCITGIENYGIVPWQTGDFRMINITPVHAVWNKSNVPRIHIIIHGYVYEDKEAMFKQCVIDSYNKLLDEYI